MAVYFQTNYFSHLYSAASTQQNANDTITITTNQVNATTQSIIVDLVFANSKSVRTSSIILASFNVLAAFATAFSILYDSYCAQSRRYAVPSYKTKRPSRKFCVSQMHPAETFPLILNIGIGIQGLVFAGVQGTGLSMLFIDGCSTISQFMWPALFIVPYIQLVFGIECVRRACRHRPFQARGKYDVSICLVIIAFLLFFTWIPAHLDPQPDHCFASLLWFISGFGELGLSIFAVALGLSVMSAITICLRLSTVTMIDQHQRIAASRMVYYLVLGSVSISFVLPYFVLIFMGIASTTSSMIATVVLNLSGLMTGLLQLFLRSNTTTTAFRPKNLPNWSGDKHDVRLFGPNELGFDGHLLKPVSGPRTRLERSESRMSVLSWERGRKSVDSLLAPPPASSRQRSPAYYNPLAGNAFESLSKPLYNPVTSITREASNEVGDSPDTKLPKIPEPTAAGSSTMSRNHQRKTSYSLYPADVSNMQKKIQLSSSALPTERAIPLSPPSRFQIPQSKFHSLSPQEAFFARDDISEDEDEPLGEETEPLETFFGLSSSGSRPEADSVYSIGALLPPPPLFRSNSRHKRNSSMQSTATVQIGLRISHAQPESQGLDSPIRLEEMPPPPALPPTTYRASNKNQRPASPPPLYPSPSTLGKISNTSSPSPKQTPNFSQHVQPPITDVTRSPSLKSLPSSPRPTRQSPKLRTARALTENNVQQLSSAVYSPPPSQASSVRSDSRSGSAARSNSRSGSAASNYSTTPKRSNPLQKQDSYRTQTAREESPSEYSSSVSSPRSASSSRPATPTREQTSKTTTTRADWI